MEAEVSYAIVSDSEEEASSFGDFDGMEEEEMESLVDSTNNENSELMNGFASNFINHDIIGTHQEDRKPNIGLIDVKSGPTVASNDKSSNAKMANSGLLNGFKSETGPVSSSSQLNGNPAGHHNGQNGYAGHLNGDDEEVDEDEGEQSAEEFEYEMNPLTDLEDDNEDDQNSFDFEYEQMLMSEEQSLDVEQLSSLADYLGDNRGDHRIHNRMMIKDEANYSNVASTAMVGGGGAHHTNRGVPQLPTNILDMMSMMTSFESSTETVDFGDYFRIVAKEKCLFCNEMFDDKSKWLVHGDCYFIRVQVQALNRRDNALKAVEEGKWTFECEVCSKIAHDRAHLQRHMVYHFNKTLVCKTCGHQSYDNKDMSKHLIQHTGAKPYKCPQCPKAFSQRPGLVAHMEQHIPDQDKQVACTWQECSKMFSNAMVMKLHIQGSHARKFKPKKFKCTEAACEWAFKTARERVLHISHNHPNAAPSVEQLSQGYSGPKKTVTQAVDIIGGLPC